METLDMMYLIYLQTVAEQSAPDPVELLTTAALSIPLAGLPLKRVSVGWGDLSRSKIRVFVIRMGLHLI
jgi:hypothetical protein